jgi:hypothetical protein
VRERILALGPHPPPQSGAILDDPDRFQVAETQELALPFFL